MVNKIHKLLEVHLKVKTIENLASETYFKLLQDFT